MPDLPLAGDTICALATARGEGGIAIVRVSGPAAERVLKALFRPRRGGGRWESGRLRLGEVVDASGEAIDEAMAVLMRAPRSYTREDVAEFHLHGGQATTRALLAALSALGARPAQPGEFTRRAFLNGRIDLSQAEAVMALVSASSARAARAALRQLSGGASSFARRAADEVSAQLSAIEAANDFPEEVDEPDTARAVLARVREIAREIAERVDERAARAVREGVSVAIVGRPNVGKSALLNALLGYARAIVTEIPGTTRDVLTERWTLDGVTFELSDTAGQREAEDPVEREGILRARRAGEEADVVLLVLNASEPLTAPDQELLSRADGRYLLVANQWDRASEAFSCPQGALRACALTGEGVRDIARALRDRADGRAEDVELITQERHIACCREALRALEAAAEGICEGRPLDVAAVDLWIAMRALCQITGEDASESVIDQVFSRFCVGK